MRSKHTQAHIQCYLQRLILSRETGHPHTVLSSHSLAYPLPTGKMLFKHLKTTLWMRSFHHLLRLSHPHNMPQNRVELVRSKTSSERKTKPYPSFLHLDYSCSSHGYTCSPMFLPLQRSNYCQNAMLDLPAPVLGSLKRPDSWHSLV